MNLYGYADGNPVNESDPSGFSPTGDFAGVVGLVPGPVGEAANIVSGVDSALEGDYVGAGLSLMGEIPGLGEGAAKIVRAAARLRKAERAAKDAERLAKPTVAFNRDYHYGRTPNTAQKRAVPQGMVFDHDPPLVKHYYEGDGKGGIPGHQMSQQEREAYSGRADVGGPSTQEESDRQGPIMRGYGVRMRKKFGLPPFNLPRRMRRQVK